jgi:hypothetical protein
MYLNFRGEKNPFFDWMTFRKETVLSGLICVLFMSTYLFHNFGISVLKDMHIVCKNVSFLLKCLELNLVSEG